VRPTDDAVFDNIRKRPTQPAEAEGTTHAGEKLGPAGHKPTRRQDAQIINLKFEHLDKTKDLAAKLEHLR
jgi:hypothetical protein